MQLQFEPKVSVPACTLLCHAHLGLSASSAPAHRPGVRAVAPPLAIRVLHRELPDQIQRRTDQARFETADVEALRFHDALTLRHWVWRLEDHQTQALQHVSGSTCRVWRFYMAACALEFEFEFESGEIGIYQGLASKRATSPA